jgi:drug/metabolite transporter superfamily protein YnfA
MGDMAKPVALFILLIAALLETGGDALVRTGLRAPGTAGRFLWIAGGGAVLLAYGVIVNTPAWQFGRLLGVYVVLFFLVAQVLGWAVFDEVPSASTLVGGAFILVGGVIVSGGFR